MENKEYCIFISFINCHCYELISKCWIVWVFKKSNENLKFKKSCIKENTCSICFQILLMTGLYCPDQKQPFKITWSVALCSIGAHASCNAYSVLPVYHLFTLRRIKICSYCKNGMVHICVLQLHMYRSSVLCKDDTRYSCMLFML